MLIEVVEFLSIIGDWKHSFKKWNERYTAYSSNEKDQVEYVNDKLVHIADNIHELESAICRLSLPIISDQIKNLITGLDTADPHKNTASTLINPLKAIFRGDLFTISEDLSLKALNKRSTDIIEKLESISLSAIQEKIDGYSKSLDEMRQRYDPLLKKIELAVQEENFTKLAKDNRNSSFCWLAGVIGSILLLGIMICIFWHTPYLSDTELINYKVQKVTLNESNNYFQFLLYKNVAARLLAISVLITALTFCIRNYNSCKHNFTVNMHRANSINGARWLIDRTYSQNTADQIILHSANAIFAHQPSGYSNREPENIDIPEKVLNTIISKAKD